jgi:drug/metabolite transporter (DMT)-like permease
MRGRTLNSAILLLVIGNALAVISDVIVKLMGSGVPIFQFIFLRCIITLIILLPMYKQLDRIRPWQGLWVHTFRALMNLMGIFCMVIALTTLPLATANAVFYVAPILVMLLAVVILRPVEFGIGAIAALGGALALSINAVMVRKLPERQSTVHKLWMSYILMLPVSLLLFLWEGAALDAVTLAGAFGSAVFILGYSVTVLLAYRWVDANQVTSAEYTGLIWAVAIGWIWFAEVPDIWFVVGSAMIVVPLVLLGLDQRRRARRYLEPLD